MSDLEFNGGSWNEKLRIRSKKKMVLMTCLIKKVNPKIFSFFCELSIEFS